MDNYQNENNNNNGYYTAPESQGYNQQNNYYMTEQSDKVSVGFCILGFFVPIFALIYFIIKKKEKPKCAKAVGICGLVSFILNLIVVVVSFAVTGSILNKSLDMVDKTADSGFVEEIGNKSDFDDNSANINEYDNKSSNNTSENWKDYTVMVNDTAIQLPIQYSEFSKKTGYTFNDSQDAQQTLKNNYTTTVTLSFNNNNIHATFINTTAQMTTLDSCCIAAIRVSNHNDNSNIKFVNDLTVDTSITKEQIIEMFGEPDYIFDDDNYHIMKYKDANSSYNGFEITIKDNVIIDMTIKCADIQ